jgi:hypothetical protein
MQVLDNLAFWQWFIQVVLLFFFVVGLVGIGVGIGLIMNSARTLAFFAVINRWTSMRRSMKPLEVPRDTTAIVQRNMRVLGTVFVAGGLYTLYALLMQFNADAVAFSLGMDALPPLLTGLLIDSGRWLLVAGNVAAVAVGLMMLLTPATLTELETRGGKWFSDRVITQKGDEMHTPLDRWVSGSPRAAGALLAIGSLIVVVNALLVLNSQA